MSPEPDSSLRPSPTRSRPAIVTGRRSSMSASPRLRQIEQQPRIHPAAICPGRSRLPARLATRADRGHRRRSRPLRRLGRRPARLPAPGGRGRLRPCRPGARHRGLAPRPLVPRLAPAAGDLRPLRHAHRRRRRRLRPEALQRPPAARPQGHDERGGICTSSRRACSRGGAPRRSAASWSWACRAAMCSSRPARWPSIPTSRSRRSIRLVFALFERRRSVSGVLRYLVDHDIRLPDRIRRGPDKGDVRWTRPNRTDAARHAAQPGLCRSLCLWPAHLTAACGCPASRTAAVASSAIQEPGWCCAAALVRPTLTGTPTSGTKSRWPPTARRHLAFPRGGAGAARRAWSCVVAAAIAWRSPTTTTAVRRATSATRWRRPSARPAASRSAPARSTSWSAR